MPASSPENSVSIIIPCFNRERLVGEAIQSALDQDGEPEIIVVDDGSADGSWEIIKSFDAIRGIRSANQGPSAARNIGLAACRGRYVRFLDADDLLPPRSTASLLSASRKLSAQDIAFGAVAAFGQEQVGAPRYGYGDLEPGPLSGPTLLSRVMPCWLPLFRADTLRDLGGFDEDLWIGEDYDLAVRLHARGYRFVQIRQATYRLRDHGDPRLTKGYGERGFERQLRAFQSAARALGDALPQDGLASAERTAMARLVWVLGREAARASHRTQAEALFYFAETLGGGAARVGNPLVRLLSRTAGPYGAERLIEAFKTVAKTLRIWCWCP